MYFLETDWPVFFLAAGGFVTVLGATLVSIIVALKANSKADAAAVRREEIATTVLNPSTAVQSAPPVAPPKE